MELEKKNSADVFEAFGQKFPVESATRWGIPIIVGIQFYFFVHLAEYRSRRFGKVNCAWIGVYKSSAARFLFCASALIFPVGAITFASIRADLLPPRMVRGNFLLKELAIMVSAALVLLIARQYFGQHIISIRQAAKATNESQV